MQIKQNSTNMIREYLLPVAIVKSSDVKDVENLLKDGYSQVSIGRGFNTVRLEKGDYVILDFGKELNGTLRIIAQASNATVRIRLGESVGETSVELGYKGACNDHSPRDVSGVRISAYSDTEQLISGFRYARIDVTDGGVTLNKILVGYTHADVKRVGSFTCDDEVVNRIYETAAHTVTLCLQNGVIWDGIKRDRLAWVGDMYSEVLALTNLYDNYDNIKYMLDMTRELTPLPDWMNTMPTYSLWWILTLGEYVDRSGDKEIYARSKDYILGLMQIFDEKTGEDGLLTTIKERSDGHFVDWQSHGSADEKYGASAILKLGAEAARKLLAIDGTQCAHVDSILAKVAKVTDEPTDKKSPIAMCVYAGQPADVKRLVDGGAKGVSTFMSWVILISMHERGYKKEAAAVAKEYYKAMLDLGATSFWEDFDIDWVVPNICPITKMPEEGEVDVHGDYGKHCYIGYRHSLCHGWSAGVIEYFIREILGVKRISASEVVVEPYPAYGNMKAVVPIGKGSITVEVTDGVVKVAATEGIKVTVK